MSGLPISDICLNIILKFSYNFLKILILKSDDEDFYPG